MKRQISLIFTLAILVTVIIFAGCGKNGDDPDVTDLVISTRWTAMTDSETRTISAVAYDSDGAVEADMEWSSSNPSVATVSGGIISAFSAGTALITASAGGVSSEPCTLQVADEWILYSDSIGLRVITPDNEIDHAIPGTYPAVGPMLWHRDGIIYEAEALHSFSYLYFKPFDTESSVFVFDGYVEPISDMRFSNDGEILLTKYLSYSFYKFPGPTGLSSSIDNYVDFTVSNVDLREFDVSPSGGGMIVDASTPVGPRMFFISSDGVPGDTLLTTSGKCPRFSPDGSTIAYINTGRIWLADVATLIAEEFISEGSSIEGLCWAPDGDDIAICVRNVLGKYEMWLGNISTGVSEKLTNARPSKEGYFPQWVD